MLTTTGNVTVIDPDGFTVGTVDGLSGVSTSSGAVNLTVQNGNLTVAKDVLATTGVTVNLNGGDNLFTIQAGSKVQTGAGGVSIKADNIDLSGAINASAGTQTVVLQQLSAGRPIDLGAEDVTQLSLTNAELNQITASILRVGNGSSGPISVNQDVSITKAGTYHLFSGAGVSGTTAAISANQLAINATGDVKLTDPATNVSTLAILTGGSIQFSNAGGINVGLVDGVTGLNSTATSGDITLSAGGAVDVLNAINAGAGTVRIGISTGGITQAAAGTIIASALGVTNAGAGNIALTSSNQVATFAASNSVLNGTIQFKGAGAMTLGAVTGDGPLFSPTTGVSTVNGDVTLNAQGAVVIDSSVLAGTGTVRIQTTTGGITEHLGDTITAATLGLSNSGTGDITLGEANHVQSLAIANNSTGLISFNDTGDLTIGSVTADGSLFGAISGVATGDLTHTGGSINVKTDGTLSANQSVTTKNGTGGAIHVDSAVLNVALTAGAGDIILTGGGPDLVINVAQSSSSSLTYTAQRDLLIHSTIAANTDISLTSVRQTTLDNSVTASNGSITATVGGALTSNGILTAGTDILLKSTGTLSVSNNVHGTRDVLLVSTGADVQLNAPINGGRNVNIDGHTVVSASATLTASGGMTITSVGATTLTAAADISSGAGGLLMTVGLLTTAADISTASGIVNINGPVTLTSNVTWVTNTAGPGANLTVGGTIDGTTAQAQNIALTTGSGDINITGNAGASTALGNILITQPHNTTFGGSLTAKSFLQQAGGQTLFVGAVITSGTVPSPGTAGFQFTGQSIQFAAGTSSLDTNGQDVSITANAINLPNTFLNATGKTVTIQTLSNATSIGLNDATQQLNINSAELATIHSSSLVIGQSANTGGIKIGTDGPITTGENVTLLTAASVQVNGQLQLTGANKLLVQVGMDLNFASSGGISTSSGDLTLNVGRDMMVSGAIATDSGVLTGNVTHDLTTIASALIQTNTGALKLASGNNIVHAGRIQSGIGPINVTATAAMTSSGLIASNTSNVVLSTGHQMSFTSTAIVKSTSGDLTITSGTTSAIGAGPLSMADGAVIDAGTGRISLTANGDITLGQIATTNNTINAINVTSTSGGIANASSAATTNIIDRTAGSLVTLSAVKGIGSTGGPPGSPGLQTSIFNLNAVNASNLGIPVAGDIRINDVNPSGFAIQKLDQQGSGLVAVTSQGTIVITAASSGGHGIDAGTGAISVTAKNATSTLDIRTAITTTGGGITLQSDGNIILGDVASGVTGRIQSAGGNIAVSAGNAGAPTGQLLMRDGSVISSSAGTINLSAQTDVILSQIVTTNATSSAVSLFSRAGGIVNGGNSAGLNIDANAVGSLVTIQSAVGIGSKLGFVASPQLLTSMNEVSIINGSAVSPLPVGTPAIDINIDEVNSLKILQIVQNNPGAVNVTTQGSLQEIAVGLGITATSGPVKLVATGAAGNVKIDGIIRTTGGAVTIDADQDVLLPATSNVNSSGGAINVVAGAGTTFSNNLGAITMSNGAAINGAGGPVQLTAEQDIVLGSVSSFTGPASLVGITSHRGAIVSGHKSGVNDVTAGMLVLQAATGIGNGTSLQTSANMIAALNSTSGDVQISNGSGTPLVIGTINGIVGISDTSSHLQQIVVLNNSSISVNAPILNPTGGSIQISTVAAGGNIDVQAAIAATGGNGNITMMSLGDIHLLDNGIPPEIQVVGTGIVTLNAQNQVIIDPNVIVQTSTGAIGGTPPFIANIQTPQITAEGDATASFDYGRPGEHNFTVTVNWGDGTVISFNAVNPGHVSLTHRFLFNPTVGDPAAPITIRFTVTQDPHVNVVSKNINQNTVTATSVSLTPGTGLATFASSLAPPIVFLTIPDAAKVVSILPQILTNLLEATSLQVETIRAEQLVAPDRMVAVEVLSPDGGVLQRIPLPESILDGALDVVRRLPDGNYRFQLQEPGEERQRLILEFEVRQGKIVDKNDESYRPPSATKVRKGTKIDNPDAPPADPETTIDAADVNVIQTQFVTSYGIEEVQEFRPSGRLDLPIASGINQEPKTPLVGWSSLSTHQAWKRADRVVEQMAEGIDVAPDNDSASAGGSEQQDESMFTEADHQMTAASMLLVGAAVTVTQKPLGELRRGLQKPLAQLSRAAQLFRKYTNTPG